METFKAHVRRARTRQVPIGARASHPDDLLPARPRHRRSGGTPASARSRRPPRVHHGGLL
ncbi:hypothetical protein M885DRAFT_523579, partial [Pelagophyceae sp. CCMP2097]